MAHFTLKLLGTFQAQVGNRHITDFATDKARALLVYLAVEKNKEHRREALAAMLWPDQPEERARQSLRQALSHLRQALCENDTACPVLLAERNEMRLNPAADAWIDVEAFSTLASAIDRHPHRSRDTCLSCLRRTEAMISLYHGEFLAGFLLADSEPFEEWVMLKREWLHVRAMEGLSLLADYCERRGEFDQARQYTQRQVQLEPWCEEAHRQLMRLLALSGQRSAALAQYEVCRRILQSEFGVEPATETVQVWAQIRDTEGFLSASPAAQRHMRPLTAQPTPFLGREAELDDLADQLAHPDCRLVTLTGPGGVGKTRLALKIAEDHRGLFADGVAFVNLAPVTQEDLIPMAIGSALELTPAGKSDAAWLCQHLRRREMLLVLDNFEHLVDCGELLSTLLRCAPHVTLLVTSREKLRRQEEWVFALEGLTYPNQPGDLPAEPLAYSALALFQQRATQVQRRFALTTDVLPDAVLICQLVEGLPLGVELAAAAVAERSCKEIAAALAQTLDSLETSWRNVPARHRSLRAAFEHSWTLLTSTQQHCFTALAVFAGSFDAEAAQAVAAASRSDLTRLATKSLLSFENGRYRWHQATHQYAAEKLAADPERAADLHNRHSSYYAVQVSRYEPLLDGAEAGAAIDALECERANLRSAWEWAVSRQRIEDLVQMIAGISKFYRLRGPAQEGLLLIVSALDALRAAETAPFSLLGRLLTEQAELLDLQSRYDEALQSAAQVIALSEQIPSQFLKSKGLFLQGQTLQHQGKMDAATQALERGLQCAQDVTIRDSAGHPRDSAGHDVTRLQADLLRQLGNVASRRGEQARAQQLYEEALSLYRVLGDRPGETAVLNNLGAAFWDRGDYGEAQTRIEEALSLYRALGNLPGEAKALNNLANVAAEQWDYGTALRHYQAALKIHRAAGNILAQSAVLNNLGALLCDMGSYAEARDAYRQALAIYRKSGNLQAEGETLANLCLLEVNTGNPAGAIALGERAMRASQTCEDRSNLANTYTYLGKAHAALERWDDAESNYREALTIRHAVPHPGRMLELTAELAHVAWRRGNTGQALSEIAPVLDALQDASALEGTEDAAQVYWICYEILRAASDPRASAWLAAAQARLREQADRIRDPDLRRSFLEHPSARRQILAAR